MTSSTTQARAGAMCHESSGVVSVQSAHIMMSSSNRRFSPICAYQTLTGIGAELHAKWLVTGAALGDGRSDGVLKPRLANAAAAGRQAHSALVGGCGGRQRLIQCQYGLGQCQGVHRPRPGWLGPAVRARERLTNTSDRSQPTYTWWTPIPLPSQHVRGSTFFSDKLGGSRA